MAETSQPRAFGEYVVDRELGRGGMGVVYAATHEALGKRVAIKVLLGEVSRDVELIERFKNEARAASAIEHPSIVEIHTVGQVDGAVYIVMELLQGESLATRLKAKGAILVADAIGLARQCANALDAAHRVGIVHRDLKPDNVFLVPDIEVAGGDRVKLLDFGIAKLVGDGLTASAARTVTGAILGTPHYMSPEQCEGAREVDARSDLYSLGCMLFQMVTGRLPFQSAGIGGLIGMHLHVAPPTLRSVRPDAPEELEELVSKLLAKPREERIQTAAEVAASLAAMSPTASLSRMVVRPQQLGIVDADTPTVTADSRLVVPPKRRVPWLVIGAGTAVAVVAFVILNRESDPPRLTETRQTVPDPEPRPIPTPTPPREPPTIEVTPELAVGQRLFAEGDLLGAHKLVRYVLDHDPKDARALALEVAVTTALAKQTIGKMRVAAARKKFDELAAHHRTVPTLTQDPALRSEADAIWRRARPEAEKANTDRARATLDAKRVAGTLYRIETGVIPLLVARACSELISQDPTKVPWKACILAACRNDPRIAYVMINRAPAAERLQLMNICPEPRK